MPYPLWLAKALIRTGLAQRLPAVRRQCEGGQAFLHYYSDRVLTGPAAEARSLLPVLEPRGADVIDLAQGNAYGLRLTGSAAALLDGRLAYPPPLGNMELREAVAEKLRRENGIAVAAADEVLITAGATAAFAHALDAFVNPGNRVLLLDPTYLLYPLMIRQRRGRVVWLPTGLDQGRTVFSVPALVKLLRSARMLVLNSPANPTGGVLAREDLEQIAWWCDRYDVLIFSDEVYERYGLDGAAASIGGLRKARRRTLTAGSVSKSHGLAGLRVGWLAGHQHLVRPCMLSAVMSSPFVSAPSQSLALAALRTPREAFHPLQAEFRSRRQYVVQRLQAMGLGPHWPGGAFYVWLPVAELGAGDGRTFAERLLREKRVSLLPGDLFGPSGRNCVRLSFAVGEGRLREGLNRLAEWIRDQFPAAEPAPPSEEAA